MRGSPGYLGEQIANQRILVNQFREAYQKEEDMTLTIRDYMNGNYVAGISINSFVVVAIWGVKDELFSITFSECNARNLPAEICSFQNLVKSATSGKACGCAPR